MPFKPGKSGNPNGRPKNTPNDPLNPRSLKDEAIKDKEFQQIMRRLKPISKKALEKLDVMLDCESTTDAARMKAIVFAVGLYREMVDDFYTQVVEEPETEEEDDHKPLFKLTM